MNDCDTDQIPYPILLVMEQGIREFRMAPKELVERTDMLKILADARWFFIVDENLKKYRITGISIIKGNGWFGGYSFDGPFLLKREVIFRARLSLLETLDAQEVAKLLAERIRKSQGAAKNDVARFWEAFEISNVGEARSLSVIRSFFSSFRWGD